MVIPLIEPFCTQSNLGKGMMAGIAIPIPFWPTKHATSFFFFFIAPYSSEIKACFCKWNQEPRRKDERAIEFSWVSDTEIIAVSVQEISPQRFNGYQVRA